LDPEASLFRPPARLRAVDLLPGVLASAWTGVPQTTTVGKLYAALKSARGRPWPSRQFIDVVNEAVNQGILVRGAAGPEFTSVITDADRDLRVPASGTSTPRPTPPPTPGVKETSEVVLDISQLQDFVEEVAPALTKVLAGSVPEFGVKIRLKGKPPANLSTANELLRKTNPDWRFGD
jgi:hypothetical protein